HPACLYGRPQASGERARDERRPARWTAPLRAAEDPGQRLVRRGEAGGGGWKAPVRAPIRALSRRSLGVGPPDRGGGREKLGASTDRCGHGGLVRARRIDDIVVVEPKALGARRL